MITGIIPFVYFGHVPKNGGSSYLRVDSLVANDAGFEKWVHGKAYDNLIFQKAYWLPMMQLFKGAKILDLCDPDWIMFDVDIRELGEHVHAITCSSDELTILLRSYFPDKIVEHVPDRLDLSAFPLPRKVHHGEARKAVWFGYTHNAHETLPLLLPAIKEAGLQLSIIANLPYSEKDGIHELNPVFFQYGRSTVYKQIKEADILLNPRSDKAFYKYKSNNKSLVGWQLGLPVAVINEDVLRLMNPDERNREVSNMQPIVRNEYSIKKTADQYRSIINRIRQRYF
jgi:hypothetical protein